MRLSLSLNTRRVRQHFDGQPLVGARGIKSGMLNLDRQSTARLERVEVVKGAASALYRSDVTRLDGLSYTMAGQGLLPDERLAAWVVEMARGTGAAAATAPR